MEASFTHRQVTSMADSSDVAGCKNSGAEKLETSGKVPSAPDEDSFKLEMDHKRSVAKVSLFIGIPLFLAMAIKNFIRGDNIMAFSNCMELLILILLGFVIMRRIEEKSEYRIYSVLFRLFFAVMGVSLVYDIGFQSNFSRIEWCYIYPVLVFLAVGVREGAIWVSIFYGILAFLILNFDLQGITLFQMQELRSRFLVSFFAVCILSLFLEQGFRHVQQRLLHHQSILKESENRYRQAYEQLNMEMQERKRAEEALLNAAQQWRTTFDGISDVVCLLDSEGRILRCNKAMVNLLGKPFSEIINRTHREIIHVMVDPAKECPFERMRKTRGRETDILLINDRWFNIAVDPLINDAGCLIGGVHIMSDITERMRSEEAAKQLAQVKAIMAEIGRIISSTLKINEVYEQFAKEVRKLISFDGIAINMINYEEGTVTVPFVSEIAVPGCQPGEVLPLAGSVTGMVMQRRSGLIIETEEMDEFKNRFPTLLTAFDKGLRSLLVVPLLYKDRVIGALHFRSVKSKAYSDKDLELAASIGNQIAGAIANAQLFIERKRAEESLRKSEERYRTILEIIEEGYFEVDLAGNFTFVNDAECGNLGYTREELIGRNNRQYTDETMARKLYQTFNGVYRTGESVKVLDLEVIRKDGIKALNEISASLIRDSEGKPVGFRGVSRDITERKRAEEERLTLQEQLRQSQKMEAIGQLAGGVAHDFNNLLTVISGYSDLILAGSDQANDLHESIQEIKRSSEKTALLTRQLLAFSRKQVLQPKILKLNTLVTNIDKMLRRLIGENIDLATLLDQDLGEVKADPGQIEQVILNLAVNARDAIGSGGKITIETANAELDEEYAHSHVDVTPGRYIMLSVSDTGCGMSQEVRERIFEPFFTTKEKDKGTGLGLSTVYGIVKQSGGTIWVYSEPEKGTTFKIYLPRIEEEDEPIGVKEAFSKSAQGSETILVVEDEEVVRRVACIILQRNGYHILQAANGEEALRLAQGQNGKPIHLMVTDVVMPGMSGPELAKHFASQYPEIRVLFMSGYTNNAIIHHEILKHGMPYLQKPFTSEALAWKVREVLDKR